jgi:hypothetical protein
MNHPPGGIMIWKPIALLLLTAGIVQVFAQYDEETEVAYSCSLSIKITVFPPDSTDKSGRGFIEVMLSDKNGIPVSNMVVHVTATCGSLSCQAPGWYDDISSISSDKTCFTTNADGKIQVYLSNVPFNTQGRILATSFCNEINVKGTGTFLISRKSLKKRLRVKR